MAWTFGRASTFSSGPEVDLDRDAVPELLELVAGLVRDPRVLRVGVELLPLRCQGEGVAAVGGRIPGQRTNQAPIMSWVIWPAVTSGDEPTSPVSAPAMATGTSKAVNAPSSARASACAAPASSHCLLSLVHGYRAAGRAARSGTGRILVTTPGRDKVETGPPESGPVRVSAVNRDDDRDDEDRDDVRDLDHRVDRASGRVLGTDRRPCRPGSPRRGPRQPLPP